ncbi:MAG: cell division protein ZapA [Steroidobacteraceae bacterium]|jgi:cell division protein ZapA
MSQDPARVNVRILDRDYMVACPHDERPALLDAAEYLNARMREVRDSGKVVGLDRVAVMVALNMANELLQLRTRGSRVTVEASDKVRALRERLESALGQTQPLEL